MADVPDRLLHHEDFEIGKTIAFGSRTVTKEEIVAFARRYDPQPLHLDEDAAKASIVGGLCASGFHSCALLMRIICDGVLVNAASLGSPGVEEVRWTKPVRPGDTLSARFVCLEKRALASRAGVGISKIRFELVNQRGEVAVSWLTNQLTRMRAPPATSLPSGPRAERPRQTSLWEIGDAPVPSRDSLYFEDRVIGEMMDLGSHTFERDEIITFAQEFDPQPFHLDEAAARESLFGGLCASGWHTAAIFIRQSVHWRQLVEAELGGRGLPVAAYGPSPGFRDLKWTKPVFVGDTIAYRSRLSEKRQLKSRPDRGLLVTEAQGRNRRGEVVFYITAQILAERRLPGGSRV